MFKKIVSKLPFNPSLISHLQDYDLRLKKELRLRIIALSLLIIVIVLQLSVLSFPPTNSTTQSPNDLVNTRDASMNHLYTGCANNIGQYRVILTFYGIKCDVLKGSTEVLKINSNNGNFFSLNRLAYGENDEQMIAIGNQDLYIRHLSYSNKLSTASIKVFRLRLDSTTTFIDADSGNIISSKSFLVSNQTLPRCSKNQPKSCLSYYISARDVTSGKSDVNNSTVSSKDIIAYTLLVTNSSGLNLPNFRISVNLSNALAYSNLINTYGGNTSNNSVSYLVKHLSPGQTQTDEIITRVKSPLPINTIDINDPSYFSQKMITTFGNTVVVSVPKSFNKFFEINLNNGLFSSSYQTSFVILVIMSLIMLYFTLRIILIREEIRIIKHSRSNLTKSNK